MCGTKGNVFARNKKWTVVIVVLCFTLISVVLAELLLQKLMGLGNPVIYDSSPLYGYRPLPNREYVRFHGAKIRFNNLGLRAERDFDADRHNKILFLGDSVTYGGSYINNDELFSHLAVKGLEKYQSGNAGVNAWGVENVYGLIVDANFLPAEIYVTTFPEGDFYRGLRTLRGLPFFSRSPRFALNELWLFFCHRQNGKRYKSSPHAFVDKKDLSFVVERAVKKLKEMDILLKEKGFHHLLFITPVGAQVLEGANKDPLVEKMLMEYDLEPNYIVDKLDEYALSDMEKDEIFYDGVHLSRRGHEIWASIIRNELDKLIADTVDK
ncbi:MAG: hypothetical protein JSU70_05950 [Phycisphaerales bacterium]|nr:MAG: hypothetical protein JSU70_05950 [Phycisphaerales bacterium]